MHVQGPSTATCMVLTIDQLPQHPHWLHQLQAEGEGRCHPLTNILSFLFFTTVTVRCLKTFKSNMYYWVLTVYAVIEGRKSLIQQHRMNLLTIQRQLWFCSTAYMRFMRVSTRVDQDWCMTYNSLHWDLGEETYLKFMKLVPGEHSALLGLSLNINSLFH
jgi:hypothetical protein